MRPIDAEAHIDEVNELWQNHRSWVDGLPVVHFGAVIDLIGAAPTIEAKPVVHAHWKGKPLAGYATVRCSACNSCFSENNGRWKYCPECGAQMDEVTE